MADKIERGTAEQVTLDMMLERIESISKALRRMADEVDMTLKTAEERPAAAVSTILHTVLWGVPNLNLDILASQAERLHDSRAIDAERAEFQAARTRTVE